MFLNIIPCKTKRFQAEAVLVSMNRIRRHKPSFPPFINQGSLAKIRFQLSGRFLVQIIRSGVYKRKGRLAAVKFSLEQIHIGGRTQIFQRISLNGILRNAINQIPCRTRQETVGGNLLPRRIIKGQMAVGSRSRIGMNHTDYLYRIVDRKQFHLDRTGRPQFQTQLIAGQLRHFRRFTDTVAYFCLHVPGPKVAHILAIDFR